MRGLALGLLLAGAGCGDSRALPPDPVELEPFVEGFGGAFCRRIYDCCATADLATVSPGTDEASCAAVMTGNARSNAALLLGFQGIAYDPDAAAACLETLRRDDCSALFGPVHGDLLVCQTVFTGTFETNTRCEDDQQCVSHRCTGRCAATPALTCAASQFFDRRADACLPRALVGADCALENECAQGSSCVLGACATLLHDGDLCLSPEACDGTCALLPDGSGQARCRPGYCGGL